MPGLLALSEELLPYEVPSDEDAAGLLYTGEDDLVAAGLLTDDLDEVLRDTEADLPVLLLVPMPLRTEVPLLTELAVLLLPEEELDSGLIPPR